MKIKKLITYQFGKCLNINVEISNTFLKKISDRFLKNTNFTNNELQKSFELQKS